MRRELNLVLEDSAWYEGRKKDLDMRGKGRYQDAINEAFRRTGGIYESV